MPSDETDSGGMCKMLQGQNGDLLGRSRQGVFPGPSATNVLISAVSHSLPHTPGDPPRPAEAVDMQWGAACTPSLPTDLLLPPQNAEGSPGGRGAGSGLPFGPRSQASLQKAQGPGVCKLPKPPASRALCQADSSATPSFPSPLE